MLKIGCCGFPKGMRNYFQNFEVVEVQSTFYNLPTEKTAEKWYSEAIEINKNFEFAIKSWQLITHPPESPTYRKANLEIESSKKEKYGFFKPTREVFSAWENFEKICKLLNAKIVLFQTPSKYKPEKENIKNMEDFFSSIEKNYKFVWEPRGKEWTDEIVERVCKKLALVHCVDPFDRLPVTKDFAYFRLHGSPPGKKMYNYKYTDEDLKKISSVCKKYETVYAMFNNIYMYEDALRFKFLA